MPAQDKVLLMHKVEGTLRPRMFANLLDEAVSEIQDHLDDFDVVHHAEYVASGADDLLRLFLDAKRSGGRSEKTIVRYQYVIERALKHMGLKTRDVSTAAIRTYFSEEQARGVSDSTIDGLRQVLNGYFAWLEHEKMIPMNPVFNIEAVRYQKKVRESLSETDLERIKRSCSSVRDMAIINLFLSTGCRVSEIVNLNRSDVDFSSGECVVLGKGNKERTVYINDVAAMTLKEYLATRNDDCEALFINKCHCRLNAGGIREMLRKISIRSGVENIHPHRFRRTMITFLLNRGMAIQDVAIIAGHDKIDTTMKYYHASKARVKSSYHRFMF